METPVNRWRSTVGMTPSSFVDVFRRICCTRLVYHIFLSGCIYVEGVETELKFFGIWSISVFIDDDCPYTPGY